MSNEFLKLSHDRRRELLVGAEPMLGIKRHHLEKDIWICWVSIPFYLIGQIYRLLDLFC